MKGSAAPEGAGGVPLQRQKASRRRQSRGYSSPFRGRPQTGAGTWSGTGSQPATQCPPTLGRAAFPCTGHCVPGLQSPTER